MAQMSSAFCIGQCLFLFFIFYSILSLNVSYCFKIFIFRIRDIFPGARTEGLGVGQDGGRVGSNWCRGIPSHSHIPEMNISFLMDTRR